MAAPKNIDLNWFDVQDRNQFIKGSAHPFILHHFEGAPRAT
jgi:hypothetical protein